eukprot:TRINITY_DN8743_c0_g2_i10.p1 TRINITY_DN8743_c0_g2~~TRINITY_DN8743_c0_g2_i10.p1  ORF type:complete len:357 (+),score=30.49 TRINITY_DN8743_c0_g2_i10:229-1299(+)
MLQVLLDSINIFWPRATFNSAVLVVLDAESPADAEACRRLEANVTCIFEEVPEFLKTVAVHSGDFSQTTSERRKGVIRLNWSLFHADAYSSANFIALVDADVAFHTFAIPQLLFDWDDDAVKPVVFGAWRPLFVLNPLVLDMAWIAEFMDSFPFVMHRQDFAGLRAFVTSKMDKHDFGEALGELVDRLAQSTRWVGWWRQYQPETIGFYSIAGHFLWHHKRDKYAWSIQHAVPLGLPAAASCPRLRVATHLGPFVGKARRGRRDWLAPAVYRSYAFEAISAGLHAHRLSSQLQHLLFSADGGPLWFEMATDTQMLARMNASEWALQPTKSLEYLQAHEAIRKHKQSHNHRRTRRDT